MEDELIALNEKFHKARHDYDVLMESSMSRYSRPAPAPSTNPFGPPQPYQPPGSSYQPPQGANRPQSGFGYGPNKATPPSTSQAFAPSGAPSSPYAAPPQQAWDGYQPPPQSKPWEPPVQPPPQQNPWENQPSQPWEPQPPQDHRPSEQWDNQYQAPSHPPPPIYGGGLDELASPTSTSDKPQQQWYEPPAGPPSQPYMPLSKPETKPSYPYSPSEQQSSYAPSPQPQAGPPPQPAQAPPAIPFEQKPQLPYPTGKGKQPYFAQQQPKPPATYDPYASLRSLGSSSNVEATTRGSETQAKGEEGKPADGGYYGVST